MLPLIIYYLFSIVIHHYYLDPKGTFKFDIPSHLFNKEYTDLNI